MFCKFCGKQLPDGSEFCSACGKNQKDQVASATMPSSVSGSSVKEITNNFTDIALEKTAGLPRVLIAKVCVLIALIAFFLPFISISCSYQGEKVEESYSGFRIMLSAEKDDDEVAERADSDPKPNIFLIAAFAGGIATAVFIFYKKKYKLAAIISGVSALVLILFRMTFNSYYDFPDEFVDYIDVDSKFGLILCILAMLATAAACFLEDKSSDSGGL